MMQIPGETLVSKFRHIFSLTECTVWERELVMTEDIKWSTEKSYQEEDHSEERLLCRERSVSFRTPRCHVPLSRPCAYFLYL